MVLAPFIKSTIITVAKIAMSKQRIRGLFRIPFYENALYLMISRPKGSKDL